jgi:hypothetical protein
MKRNLIVLTGIVFVIVLAAGGCKQGAESQGTTDDKGATKVVRSFMYDPADSTTVEIYLKDTLIGCMKHLEMYDEKFPGVAGDRVIDSLETVVRRGYTVVWKKTHKAEIKKIHHIRIMDSTPWNLSDTCIVISEDSTKALFHLKIPSDADTGTVKYEIIFEDKDDNIWSIDPYLKIPDLDQ